jgi:hypothetical protein
MYFLPVFYNREQRVEKEPRLDLSDPISLQKNALLILRLSLAL